MDVAKLMKVFNTFMVGCQSADFGRIHQRSPGLNNYSKFVLSEFSLDWKGDKSWRPTLHMPVSIDVTEDAWMYAKVNSMNDGLMNSAS